MKKILSILASTLVGTSTASNINLSTKTENESSTTYVENAVYHDTFHIRQWQSGWNVDTFKACFFDYGKFGYKNANDFINSGNKFKLNKYSITSYYSDVADEEYFTSFQKETNTSEIAKYMNKEVWLTDSELNSDWYAAVSVHMYDDPSRGYIYGVYTSHIHKLWLDFLIDSWNEVQV